MLGDRRSTTTLRQFVGSAATTAHLLAAGQLSQPTTHLARPLRFADGTTSYVFREAAVDGVATPDPAVLVVRYRGLYEWNGADLATDYAETLARLLRVVSVRGAVRHHVVAGLRRDALLRDPTLITDGPEWARVIPPERVASRSA